MLVSNRVLSIALSVVLGSALGVAPCHASGKKGICLTANDKNLQVAKELQATWGYNWDCKIQPGWPATIEYVPMVWGGHGDRSASQLKLTRSAKELLGFNEPDFPGDQALTVDEALSQWPVLMRQGLRLGSPAAGDVKDQWMTDFMAGAAQRNYQIDFICYHWYGRCNATRFFDRLKWVYDTYHKPIWITEFAMASFEGSYPQYYSPNQAANFLRVVIPKLERLPYVERYAWFSVPNGWDRHPAEPVKASNAIYSPMTSKAHVFNAESMHIGASSLSYVNGDLTPLGKVYASLGNDEVADDDPASVSPPKVIADFEDGSYKGFTLTGDCWRDGPATNETFGGKITGFGGRGFATTLDLKKGAAATGVAVSPDFIIDKPLINYKIGGGYFPDEACLNLVLKGAVIRTATGDGSAELKDGSWDVTEAMGSKVHFEIVDSTRDSNRGYISVDDIRLCDLP